MEERKGLDKSLDTFKQMCRGEKVSSLSLQAYLVEDSACTQRILERINKRLEVLEKKK